jgi:hypothetical protein
MNLPRDPTTLPCPCCSGRRYYVIRDWQSAHGGFNPAPITIGAPKRAEGFLRGQNDFVHVPMMLRVCVDCGAAQPFVSPSAVAALAALSPPAAEYVDGDASANRYR